MDLTEYRNSESEKSRVADLMSLLPQTSGSALDIGSRDGFISRLLAERYSKVTALDLELPDIEHERIICAKGDITALAFTDASFDLVFCAEVLEHIPPDRLQSACDEMSRVAREHVLVGVPYKQDIRVACTTCSHCGKSNPPWGHVNSFDEARLCRLFPDLEVCRTSHVGKTNDRTNGLSAALMNMAGNPYGTYSQEEPCVHCGKDLGQPRERRVWQKVATKIAFVVRGVQNVFLPTENSKWIHLLLRHRLSVEQRNLR